MLPSATASIRSNCSLNSDWARAARLRTRSLICKDISLFASYLKNMVWDQASSAAPAKAAASLAQASTSRRSTISWGVWM